AHGDAPRPCLELAGRLDDQPRAAEQRVAEHQRRADEKTERREPVERATCEARAREIETLHERAEHDTLKERRGDRAPEESPVPDPPAAIRLEAKLERDAAKDQTEQHEDERQIERRQYDRVSHGEHREQPAGAEN